MALFVLAILATVVLNVHGAHESTPGSNRPNIVLILADDLGWNDVSFHGSREIPTPNLDALAYDGIILSNYYVQPMCTPSRASLLTGRYPIRYGLQHYVISSARPYGLLLNETIMPEYLKQLGYSTHMVGKWHLGFHSNEHLPTNRGFDSHVGYYHGIEDYITHIHAANDLDSKTWGFDFHRNGKIEKSASGQYSTEIFTKESEDIIANHDISKPLFLYVAQQAVHSPLQVPNKYVERMSHIENDQRRLYAAMVATLDESVGNVTKALHKRGILNNTILIFTTDNGGSGNGLDSNYASNWPLRGMKGGLWEGGVRGTGFIWSPLLRQSGYVSQHLIHVSDWLPTLLSAAGYDAGKLTSFLDGIDQWKSLSENLPTVRTEILLNSDSLENSSAILVGGMKLLHANYGFTVNCRNWYKPNQEAALEEKCEMKDEVVRNMENSFSSVDLNYKPTLIENEVDQEEENSNLTTRTFQTSDNFDGNMFSDNDNSWYFEQIDQIHQILLEMGKNRTGKRQTLTVRCGIRPSDVLTNCLPWIRPCLFNITVDPCEYRNLAELMPDVASMMLEKLENYERNAIPPIVMPVDENGFPYLNGGNWIPWIKPTDSFVKSDL